MFVHIPSRTWISNARYYGSFFVQCCFFWWMMVLFCWYWNCSPLFKVSFHKHCRANNLSPIYKPSTIPWSVFHPLIYIHITIIIGSEYNTDGAFIGTLGFGLFSLGIREFPISVSGDSYFIFRDCSVFMFENSVCKVFLSLGILISGACLDIIWKCFYVCNWCSVYVLCKADSLSMYGQKYV